jgi:hypothetical protein
MNSLAFTAKDAADGGLLGASDMIKFEPADENAERFAEIERRLKKLDLEMASPNIKEIKHEELAILYRQLNRERESLRPKK